MNQLTQPTQSNQPNYHIKIVKGYDKNNIPFSAFLLLSDEENINFDNTTNNKIDLTKYNIIHKMIGHNVDKKIIENINEYIKLKHIA
jgi:hypothetical protein